jgi:hypothetical protein
VSEEQLALHNSDVPTLARRAKLALFAHLMVPYRYARLERLNDSRRRTTALLPWLFPLGLLVLVVAVAVAPGWLIGLIAAVVLGLLGYGAVAWYYPRYQQFHDPDDRS